MHYKKQKNNFLTVCILSIFLLIYFALPAQANTDNEVFNCYTYDSQNHIIDGYWDDADETWYLFLTSSKSVTESMLISLEMGSKFLMEHWILKHQQ